MKSKRENTVYDRDWQQKYAGMIETAEQAVSRIRPGHRVFVGTGCGEPDELVQALAARASELPDTEIVHLLTMGSAPYATKDLAKSFRVNSFFISENVRNVIQLGMGDYTPIFLSDIPRLFHSGQIPLDVALIHVSPPDSHGLCSLGVSVDIVRSAAQNAALVIAQVNPQMPRTLGNSFLNVYELDVLVPSNAPLIEMKAPAPSEIARRIGENVASLVDDNCTLELGIGRIPQSVLGFLSGRKNLGIHTEMFTDSLIDMIEAGVITGTKKTLDRGKVVASFCMGTRRLYDYIDNNPVFAFYPTEYVNDPFVIAQQSRMIAINVALEVDLTGQVCADSLGSRFYSGIGGQVDFGRGAARSAGGKAIIALPSTARNGSISRIVSRLSEGAGVVTSRGDVHYVVTEHGVAYLHGKSVQERAIALISISEPEFREKLIREAIEAKYLRPEMAEVSGKCMVGPQELRSTLLLDDGTQIALRSIHPTDESGTKELFYALSRETVYYRFMSHLKRLPVRELQNFVYLDHRMDVALVATVPEAYGEAIVAIGRYYLDKKTNRAEIAFVVRDEWQNRGIGKALFTQLTTTARRNGIGGFTAEVLRTNKPMLAVFNNSEFKVSSTSGDDTVSIQIDFE